MAYKASLLSLTAVLILSALLTAFSPKADHPRAGQPHSETPVAAEIPENERIIAEAAIEQFIIRGRPLVQTSSHVWEYRAGTPILVSQETWGNATTSGIRVPRGHEQAFRDYFDRNQRAGCWDRPPSLTISSDFAPRCLTNMCEYWNQLKKAHPGVTGVLTVSRPGFSRDGRTAWIQVYINTGPGTSPRMTWWVQLREVTTGRWSMVEALTLTGDDRYFSHLPKTIPELRTTRAGRSRLPGGEHRLRLAKSNQ